MHDIFVEVRPTQRTGDLSPRLLAPEALSNRIEELGDSLKAVAQKLSARFDEFSSESKKDWVLNEVELAFSLDLQAEAGIVIARSSASAGFEVTLKWKSMQVVSE
jgi:Trypsin-co-occurring domain 1